MIRIEFKEPTTNTWKRWVKDCERATLELKGAFERREPLEVKDIYRRTSIKKEVYFNKEGPFRGRCAYCESYVIDFQHGDIDHFRPKAGVSDANHAPVVVGTSAAGKALHHRGYFWLAYSWKNLLPSCSTCNRKGEDGIGKYTRFPVKGGTYATTEDEVANEKPLLFNPIDPKDDDPEHHIGVDFEDGTLKAKGDPERAKACIDIFGLNKRDQLVKDRRAAMEEAQTKCIKLLLSPPATAPTYRREIDEMLRGNLNHTLARRAQIKECQDRLR
jgi:hypothetical protein